MATNEQRERLKQYLLEQQARRSKMESPEFRRMEDDRAMRAGDSSSRNNLAALLMNSAAQMGTINGKMASAQPVEDFARAQNAGNAQYRGMIDQQEQDREKRYGVDARVYQYLADKEAGQEQDEATAGFRMKTLEQQQAAVAAAAKDREADNARQEQQFAATQGLTRQKMAQDAEMEKAKLAASTAKVDHKPTTEGERKAAGFAERAQAAHDQLATVLTGGYDPTTTKSALRGMAANLPGVGHLAKSDKDTEYQQVKDDFITAVLRPESGAAIDNKEYEREERKYFPMPGDSAQTLLQKKALRERAIASLNTMAGKAAGTVAQVPNPAAVAAPEPGTAIAAPATPAGGEKVVDGVRYRKVEGGWEEVE